MFIDGTRKTLEMDHFERERPEVIIMDDETIERVNAIWPLLKAGDLILSPSLKYKSLVINRINGK